MLPALAVLATLGDVEQAVPACDEARAHCFAIQLHVASDAGGLAASPEWIAQQLDNANRHFAALDVGFQLAGVDGDSVMHVATRADRNALGAHLPAKVIHVFIVGQLDNVDDDAPVFGVTWHRPKEGRKYILVSAKAWERTLAHELGHFFGLPHSTYAVSIMNKTPRDEPPPEKRTFADEEVAAMRPALQRLVRDRVIADQPPRTLRVRCAPRRAGACAQRRKSLPPPVPP